MSESQLPNDFREAKFSAEHEHQIQSKIEQTLADIHESPQGVEAVRRYLQEISRYPAVTAEGGNCAVTANPGRCDCQKRAGERGERRQL